jgi:hypothetical protein
MLQASPVFGIFGFVSVVATVVLSVYVAQALFVFGITFGNIAASLASLGRNGSPVYAGICMLMTSVFAFLFVHYTKSTGFYIPTFESLQSCLVIMAMPLLFTVPLLAVGMYQRYQSKGA